MGNRMGEKNVNSYSRKLIHKCRRNGGIRNQHLATIMLSTNPGKDHLCIKVMILIAFPGFLPFP